MMNGSSVLAGTGAGVGGYPTVIYSGSEESPSTSRDESPIGQGTKSEGNSPIMVGRKISTGASPSPSPSSSLHRRRTSSTGSPVDTINKVGTETSKVYTSSQQVVVTAIMCREFIDLINIATGETQIFSKFKTQLLNDAYKKLDERMITKIRSTEPKITDLVKTHINILIGVLLYQQWIQCELMNSRQDLNEALENCSKLLKQRNLYNVAAGEISSYDAIMKQPEIEQALDILKTLASMSKRLALVKKQSDTLRISADEQYQSSTDAIKNSTYEAIQTQFDAISIASLPKAKVQDAGQKKAVLLISLHNSILSMHKEIDKLLKTHKEEHLYSKTKEQPIYSLKAIETEFYSDIKSKEKLNAYREIHAKIAALDQLIQVENTFIFQFSLDQRKAIVDRHLEEVEKLQGEINTIDELYAHISERITSMTEAKEDLCLIQDSVAGAFEKFKKQYPIG